MRGNRPGAIPTGLPARGPHRTLEAGQITQFIRVPQRESQRLQRAVKADDAQWKGQIARGAQDGHCIGRRAKPDIPHHKFAYVRLQSFPQPQLLDVKRLRLGHRADDGMKRLVFRQRAYAASSVLQANELVIPGFRRSGHRFSNSATSTKTSGNAIGRAWSPLDKTVFDP